MRLLTGWAASLAAMVVASTAQAQVVLAPTEIGQPAVVVSDMGGPYAAMPPDAPPFVDGPRLLPPTEVYTVVRESGFSPLGVPRQRGFVYTIAVINRDGDDGRLVIDARNGRIVRFMPAYPAGDRFDEGRTAAYGPVGPPPAVIEARRGIPRPPARIPRLAMRTPSVPLPKAAPHAVVAPKHVAAKPKPAASPAQQSAAVEAKPAETKPAVAPVPVEAKPSATIEPTQAMPAVQGLN